MLETPVIYGPGDLSAAERARIFDVAARLKSQPNTAPILFGCEIEIKYFISYLFRYASACVFNLDGYLIIICTGTQFHPSPSISRCKSIQYQIQ